MDHIETKLISRLFGSSYDYRARPPISPKDPVVVNFRLDLKQIFDVSETSQTVSILTTTYQEWRDPRLQWNASNYENLQSFSIYYSYLWIPDTTLYNTVDMYRQNVEDRSNAIVTTDGDSKGALIQLIYNTRHTVGCRFAMTYFPFDEQKCFFLFGSWTYHQEQLDYELSHEIITTESFRESDEWTLVSFKIHPMSQHFKCCKIPYKLLRAELVIKRKCLYYVFNLILPTVVINLVASFGLFASIGNEDNRHDKLQIGITTLLSYCILLLTVSGQIPRGSTSIPIISWFFFSVMIQDAIKTYVAVFLSYQDRRRLVHSFVGYIKNKTRFCIKKILKKKLSEISVNYNNENGIWLETVCLWISVLVLAVITMAMFSVASNR